MSVIQNLSICPMISDFCFPNFSFSENCFPNFWLCPISGERTDVSLTTSTNCVMLQA
jgi:hypothetical protein